MFNAYINRNAMTTKINILMFLERKHTIIFW